MDLKFHGYDCKIIKREYQNGRIALQLISKEDGELVTTATINIPEIELNENETIIKDYSENEGLLDELIKAKVVTIPTKGVRTGFVVAPIVKVLI